MSSTSNNHWQDHATQWSRITSPLRPHTQDVAIFKNALKDIDGTCLLFGVTPELSEIHTPLVAVDSNIGMIGQLWRDNLNRVAYQANWLSLPFSQNHFGGALGDGCVNMLHYPTHYHIWFQQLARVLKNRALVALRIFARPEQCPSVDEVCQQVGKLKQNFHAFKWRFAMALVAESPKQPNIAVMDILANFNARFPDRESLSKHSGWDIADINTINVYAGSTAVYSFPTLNEFLATMPPAFTKTEVKLAAYDLADCCPFVVLKYHAD